MQRMIKVGLVLGSIAAAGLPAADARAEYWSYEKDNGTQGYADALKQVPARYRKDAVRHPDRALDDYERFTPSSYVTRRPESQSQAPAPQIVVVQAPAERPHFGGLIELAPEVFVPLEDAESAAEPLRVEAHVGRFEDGRYRYFTIVRRGDRVISEIEESSN